MEDWLEPLFDAPSMRAIDAWAIEGRGVPSLELMEAAGLALADAAESVAGEGPIRIVCGKGNNGGDGLVAARRLAESGHMVEVLTVWPVSDFSGDAAANLERFGGSVRELGDDPAAALAESGAIVDAIFGTGFDGAPRDPAAVVIEAVNGAGAPVIAADIASGVDASTGEIAGAAVDADVTVAFHAAKVGHRVAPGKWGTGELRVAPIGIPDGDPGEARGGVIGAGALAPLPARGSSSTKFSSGEVLIVGGSRGLTGAVCLNAEAAMRSGAGYATVAVPGELEHIFEVKLTEAMSRGLPSLDGSIAPDAGDQIVAAAERAAAVALGGGLGRGEGTERLVADAVARIEASLVIDADGLNALAGNVEALAARTSPTVLTPHAGELARLLGRESDEINASRLSHALAAAERSQSIVVLKGDDTIVAGPDGSFGVNALSSPALATAGTGDVLTGVVAALLARGLEPFAAACAAVLAHARAGQLAASEIGAVEGVIAGDVVAALPRALAGGASG